MLKAAAPACEFRDAAGWTFPPYLRLKQDQADPFAANPCSSAAVTAGLTRSAIARGPVPAPGPDERIGQADLLADAQNRRIWTASDLISIQPTSAQIAGTVRRAQRPGPITEGE